MTNYDIFTPNILETGGRIQRKSFSFNAYKCLVWFQGNCIETINATIKVEGKVHPDGHINVSIDNSRFKSYSNNNFSFREISTNIDRVLWSNNLLGGGVGCDYANMSLFYVSGKLARIYVNRSHPAYMLELLGTEVQDVQETNNPLKSFINKHFVKKDNEALLSKLEFISTAHQRYEHGERVGALQEGARRSVLIWKNTEGCRGFDIEPGDGYLFKILNLDGVNPLWGDNVQVGTKPVRIISKDTEKIVLRGYSCMAQGPFGWIDFDGSDFGMEIDFKYGEVVRCTLVRHDKDMRIEYYR